MADLLQTIMFKCMVDVARGLTAEVGQAFLPDWKKRMELAKEGQPRIADLLKS